VKFFTPKRAFIAFPLVMICSFIPGLWLGKWIAIPFVAGSMIASSGRWVVLLKYVNADFDSKNRATAISALHMGIGILYVLFALLGGPIMDHWGGTKTVFTLLGIVTVFTVLPLGIILSRRYKPLVNYLSV
jgi:MFS family permease